MRKPIYNTLIVMILGFSFTIVAQAAPEKFSFDTDHTYPFFEIDHLGWSTTRGYFRKTLGTATLDFKAKTGSADVIIDANSLDTGHIKRDEHLRGEDFLAVAQYPTITFRTDKLSFNGDKLVKAEGQLTLHGVTRSITLTFNQFKCGEHPIYKKYYCGGDASTTIQRSDFGMTAYSGAVGDQIKLSIQIEAARDDKTP